MRHLPEEPEEASWRFRTGDHAWLCETVPILRWKTVIFKLSPGLDRPEGIRSRQWIRRRQCRSKNKRITYKTAEKLVGPCILECSPLGEVPSVVVRWRRLSRRTFGESSKESSSTNNDRKIYGWNPVSHAVNQKADDRTWCTTWWFVQGKITESSNIKMSPSTTHGPPSFAVADSDLLHTLTLINYKDWP